MLFSLFSSAGLAAQQANLGFPIAIAALACILGAEIAGICVLISKMRRARDRRLGRDAADPSQKNYAIGVVMLLSAVPQSTYLALTILSALTAFFALAFVILLIIFRACGYDYASAAKYREEQACRAAARSAAEPMPEEAEETERYADLTYDRMTMLDEEQRQEAYTEAVDDSPEEPFAVFAEERDSAEASAFEDFEEEEFESEETDADATAMAEDKTIDTDSAAPAATVGMMTQMTLPADGEPAFADGTRPYKVVEKYVTETYKEIYKETPPAQPAAASANDAVMEKLSDILDELQKRNAADGEAKSASEDEASEVSKSGARVDGRLVSVTGAVDEDDEDEDEEDGAEDARSDDEDDRDDEENDTEGDHFTGNERIIGFDEKTGCYIVAHYRKSFEAKLIQARPHIKKYYSQLKNALLAYKGSKNRISWTADSFHNGRTPIAKINVKTRILELYLALDPASLEGTVYRGRDVGAKKKYADTPFQYKLKTERKFKWALELIQRTCEEHGLSPIDLEPVDYEAQYPFETTESLVERGLIKEYIREEKPATSFELAPDHVTAVPEEDDSVIPANANFSWEFDNEMLEQKEVEAEEATLVVEPEEPETVEAEEEATEPAPEPENQPAVCVTRETVKITEMRYTERYYANAEPTYERVITTTEPIEAIAIPTAEEMTAEAEAEPETVTLETEGVVEEATEPVEEVREVAQEDRDGFDIWGDLTAQAEPEELADSAEDEAEFAEEAEEVEEITEEDEVLFFGGESTEEAESSEEDDAIGYAEDEFEEFEEEGVVEEDVDEESAIAVLAEAEETIEEPAPTPKRIMNPNVAVVDIASLEEHFPDGALINLDTLKALELILPSATTLKIYTSGSLSKAFTVEANHFTMDAITAIGTADGDIVVVR